MKPQPCPFCGNTDLTSITDIHVHETQGVEESTTCSVACWCGFEGPTRDSEDEAVAEWNRILLRDPDDPPVACGTFEPVLLKRPASEVAVELGRGLREARVFLNRSLLDVALKAGLSLVRLSAIELGVGEPATRDEVERVVRSLLPS